MDGSATNGGGGGGDNPSGKRKESGFVASIRQAWTGLQKMKKRKIDADGDGGTIQPSEQAGSTPPTSRKKRAFRTRTTEEQEEVTSASSTTSSSSSSTSSTSSSRSRTRQEVVAEARQSVTDKKRKLEALTAFLAAPATTPAKALDEPSPSAGKQKKKPKKPKKSKKQKLLHHSNTGSSNPSVDLLAAQLKTKDLRDFLLWLYAVQAKPSPAVFFSNPATLPTTVMVVIRSLGQAELIKHKGLLKNMLTTEEGGIFQKATAFNAPGSKYRVFETVATLILTDANLQKKMSTSQAKEVEKEVAVLLQEQYQELVSKLPDPTDRASLFEEFIATQEEMKASRFPIYKVSKREDWLTGSSNRPPPNLSLFVRLPKKMEKKEGVKRKHLPIVAIDCEMCLTEDGHELTRVSVIDDNYNVLYDQLVKPHKPITDYLTRWSGITEEMMTGVTTHLEDVHKAFHDLGITRKTIIAGHSVENDLLALRLFHKRVIDTTMHFPHANGPPFKNSLRYLTEKFLKRLIQQGHDGHCSVEDAKAVMELILLKVAQAGVHVSKSGDVEVSDKDDGENLFIKVRNANRKVTVIDRLVALQRYVPPQRTRGPADAFMPSPSKLAKAGDGLLPTPTALLPLPSSSSSSFVPPPNLLTTCACNTDEEIVDRLTAHLGSDSRADFIFTQLHTFEDHFASCARQSGGSAAGSGGPPPPGSFEKHLADIDQRMGRIYDALPPNGLLMVVTGRGPIVDVFRLQREKKDEGPAWTPERDRALQEAVEWARKGRTFWAVKPPSSDEATTTTTTTAEKSE